MNRYEDVTNEMVEVFLRVVEERFPKLQGYTFKLIFDLKKRVSKKKIVLASIEMSSAKIKFFSADNIATEGYDYVIIIDKKAWDVASDKDKVRLISHEMSHVFIDESGNPKLIDHDVSDFYLEMKRNEDDSKWNLNLATIVDAMYEQEKDKEGSTVLGE